MDERTSAQARDRVGMRRLYYVWNGLMRYLLFHPRVRDRLFAVEMDPDERVGVLWRGVAAAIQLNFVPPLRDVVIHNGARYFLYLFLRLFRRPDGYLCAKLAVQVLDVLLGRASALQRHLGWPHMHANDVALSSPKCAKL